MEKTKAMEERENATGNAFEDKGRGYGVLRGRFHGEVIYISLPENHPDIGKDYNDLNPQVNGGLTFGEENVFGWDYAHFQNSFNFEEHIKNALIYFRAREDFKNEIPEIDEEEIKKKKFEENKELTELLNWLVINWDNIPDKFKQHIKPNKYSNDVEGLKKEGHIVILLVDRQKPSVESCYDFDEERFGINRFGEIIWGFDSGCSCPSPWDDSYPDCYNVEKSWKEFVISSKDKFEEKGYSEFFDFGFQEEAIDTIKEIQKELQ